MFEYSILSSRLAQRKVLCKVVSTAAQAWRVQFLAIFRQGQRIYCILLLPQGDTSSFLHLFAYELITEFWLLRFEDWLMRICKLSVADSTRWRHYNNRLLIVPFWRKKHGGYCFVETNFLLCIALKCHVFGGNYSSSA